MMNESMRDEHYLQITDEKARAAYITLCDACDRRPDGLTDADQMLIRDYCCFEQIKLMAMADILTNGLGHERTNGRQRYYQENKNLALYRNYSDNQRKILAELKLTPATRKAASVDIDDDFDKFE